MSLNKLVAPDENALYSITCSSCNCVEAKVANKLEVKDFIFDAVNGDKIELSTLADKGAFGAVLKSDGNNGVIWGTDLTGGVSYNGTLPTIDGELSLYSGIDGSTIKNSSLTETDLLNTESKANTNEADILNLESDVLNLQTDKLNIDGTDIMTGNLQMGGNSITGVQDVSANGTIYGNINANSLQGLLPATDIPVNTNLNFLSVSDIKNVNNLQTESIGNNSGSFDINLADAVLNVNRNAGGNILLALNEVGNTPFYFRKSGVVDDICAEGTDELHLTTDCFGAIKKVILSPNVDTMLLRDYSLDINNNDILNAGNINTLQQTIATTTKYISNASQLPTASGGFHLLEDNTSYIICGQITLTNGIQYGNNCSVRGADFSSSITFDESSNDIIGFKSVDTNVYLSSITIIGGGGSFSAVPSFTNGLFNCDDFDVAGGFPFYARNRRFKVDSVNFITPYSMGRVRGYATLNFNNNLITGTGAFNTYEGLEVIDGLSLEFLGNKIVLFRGGADPASPAKMLRFGASIVVPVIPQKPEGLMSFNAVNVSGNIFHPRGNFENAIDFDPTSRTGLGVISSNTFIRSGGTAPLINYENVLTFNNYNVFSIENYTINANVGIVDSEPNLKSIIKLSTTLPTPTTLTKLVCLDNSQVEPINLSSRFAIKIEMNGVSGAGFVANTRLTDDVSGETALILFAEPLAATTQTLYITDMSGIFDSGNGAMSSGAITATSGDIQYYWRYCEKDPRKLNLVGTFDFNVNNNTTFSVAPNMDGMADTLCSVSSVSASAGAGSTLTLVCAKKYEEGDYVEFYASVSSGNLNLVKAVITIK